VRDSGRGEARERLDRERKEESDERDSIERGERRRK